MINSAQLERLLIMNTIGLSVVCETLKFASLLFPTSNGYKPKVSTERRNEYRECFAFIQGTGLDLLLNQYEINYDANRIRNGFNYIFHVRSSF